MEAIEITDRKAEALQEELEALTTQRYVEAYEATIEAKRLSVAVLRERSDRVENADAIKIAEENDSARKRLLDGEWVLTEEVQTALGITFAEGIRRFDFSRTAEWWTVVGRTDEERKREGQKITTYFRLKAVEQ